MCQIYLAFFPWICTKNRLILNEKSFSMILFKTKSIVTVFLQLLFEFSVIHLSDRFFCKKAFIVLKLIYFINNMALGFWFSPLSIKLVLFVSWSKCLQSIIRFVTSFHIFQKTSSICFCNIKNILGFLLQSSLFWIFPHH